MDNGDTMSGSEESSLGSFHSFRVHPAINSSVGGNSRIDHLTNDEILEVSLNQCIKV